MRFDVAATYNDPSTDVFSSMGVFDPSAPAAPVYYQPTVQAPSTSAYFSPYEAPSQSSPWGDALMSDCLLPPRKNHHNRRQQSAKPVQHAQPVQSVQYVQPNFHKSSSFSSSSSSTTPPTSLSRSSSSSGSRSESPETIYWRQQQQMQQQIVYYQPQEEMVEVLPTSTLYTLVQEHRMVASPAELVQNGYPFIHPVTKKTVIEDTIFTRGKKMFADEEDLGRICLRCEEDFTLCPSGRIPRNSQCTYHAKAYRTINGRKIHECCGGLMYSEGCCSARGHVFDTISTKDLEGFKCTPPANGPYDERSEKVYAIDCEMVYTTRGPALARVTVVDDQLNCVFDELVKPEGEVICPNTMYSGLTDYDMDMAIHSLETIRQHLFSFINDETILIGHSLESDLKALRIVHHRVLDTAIMFAREEGGMKKGLRHWSATLLNKKIQHDVGASHDSYEDAATCMELVMHEVDVILFNQPQQ